MMQNFAKLDAAESLLPTSKLVIFPLLQPDPKLSFSCYFFQGQTDAFVETFKFSLGKRQKALRCLFVEFQHIQSSEHFSK